MSKIAILTAISGALVAGSLALAGPASAHRGDAGDASAAPAGAPATSSHTSTDGQIGVGIFTGPAEAAGTQTGQAEAAGTQKIGVGIFTAPATAAGPSSVTPGITSRTIPGAEQPSGSVGAAPAA